MNAAMLPRALLMVFLALAFPVASFGHWDVGVTVGFAPPELPLYSQPPCPAPGYIWTPGYWAYSDDDEDYYWVPGTWVFAPSPGLLWTPGYWAVIDNDYEWHEGYWAPHVGFYGGINYGFGYFGVGFAGGYWRDRDFYYNRAVTNITNVNVTNVYNSTVINNHFDGGRASFNGGDGVHARPTPSDLIAAREPRRGFTSPQRFQAESARRVPELLASVNHGHPSVAATARPGLFNSRTVEATRPASGVPAIGHRSAPGTPIPDNASRPGGPSHQPASRQPLPAHAWNQPTTTHGTASQWNPRGGDVMQRSAPPRSAPVTANYRQSEPHPAAISGARPTPYQPAPAATAYRQVPSYSAPRAPQATPRSEGYAMQPRAAIPQMPRNEMSSHGSPPARGSVPAPMQDRHRS